MPRSTLAEANEKKDWRIYQDFAIEDPLTIAELYRERWRIELFFYDKHIIMQSWRQSYVDSQRITHVTSRFNFT
jgi:hypothetical protein